MIFLIISDIFNNKCKMNESDKKRFARYKKGYIQKLDEFDDDKYYENNKNAKNNNTKLGHIEKIDVKIDELVKSLVKK